MLLCFHRPGLRLLPAITIDYLQVTFGMSQILVKSPAENILRILLRFICLSSLIFCSLLIEILFKNGCLWDWRTGCTGKFCNFSKSTNYNELAKWKSRGLKEKYVFLGYTTLLILKYCFDNVHQCKWWI